MSPATPGAESTCRSRARGASQVALIVAPLVHLPLTRAGGVATRVIQVPRGEWFEYKYSRGDWCTVEKWPDCEEAENRYGFGAAWPVREEAIYGWRDLCEPCE